MALPVQAQSTIEHGAHFRQSKDYTQSPPVQAGCGLRFDKALNREVCFTQLAVALSIGKSTTVASTAINQLSRVRCGCGGDGYESTVSCNEQGSWIGRIRVTSVTAGSATVAHSYAIGNETIRCIVN